MKKKGLFIFFDGLWSTIIDSQVLLHVQEMNKSGYDFEVLVLPGTKNEYNMSLKKLGTIKDKYDIPITVKRGIRQTIPGGELINVIILYREIRKQGIIFDIIHARTDYAACVCSLLKIFIKFELIWDCRGDAEAEFSQMFIAHTLLRRVIKFMYLQRLKWTRFCASLFSDKAIFVSSELKDTKGKYFNKFSQVIPCTASDKLFRFSSDAREQTRIQLGYTKDDIVLVYSGSIVYYQCFDECMVLFKELHEANKRVKLLILTPHVEKALTVLRYFPENCYQIYSATLEQVNSYLNAADFGFLLRKEDKVNSVASPVKFAEYSLAGLPVLTTKAVKQVVDLGEQLNNVIYCDSANLPDCLTIYTNEERIAISQKAIELLSRKISTIKYIGLYTNTI
ncbi:MULTISPECIES: hypothetical protein [Pelosinus]|uniref:Glycosyl transferase group 1 n=1 Tax=Pelosinus fermentans B4 TaxID=1149862 RepID=I9ASU4_9FIRM|nr:MULTISPECIES: hypothetical protein [Pelosinus]EIW16027.1 hypothetical protein FB4_1716 [Pelosinus fermentans B4]EIW27267.1 hypothetical protein FA11_1286 [Pelosinus fermentans A11]